MGKITFNGPEDVRILGKADFDKAGVEQNKLTFHKGEAIEVDDAVAKALLDNSELFGKFSVEESGPDQLEIATDKNTSGGTSQTGTDSTGGTTAGGASKRSSTTRSA